MEKSKIALITGITGQDGSYLAEFLIKKGYQVHGMIRRSSTFNRQNIEHIFVSDEQRQSCLHYGDMTDIQSLISIIRKTQPDEIYNLAAQSHVRVSFDQPYYTAMCDSLGVLSLLEAVRTVGSHAKIYQASTSELFCGDRAEAPQSESTPFKPMSPYGVAKLYGFEISRVYRESYGMFVVNGILFNHESPRRGENFVTRKVTKGVAEIAHGLRNRIWLGNLDSRRDWGYAPEYMEAAWLMLQQDSPDDYVIATGETHSIRELVEKAFSCIQKTIRWEGVGLEEKGVDAVTGVPLVEIHSDYYRPNEVDFLCGNSKKAREKLGWKQQTNFDSLIELMVEADLLVTKKRHSL